MTAILTRKFHFNNIWYLNLGTTLVLGFKYMNQVIIYKAKFFEKHFTSQVIIIRKAQEITCFY